MKKSIGMWIVLTMIFLVGCNSDDNTANGGLYEYTPSTNEIVGLPVVPPPATWAYEELNFLPPDENALVWLIQPTFELDNIFICHSRYCDCCVNLIAHITNDNEFSRLLYAHECGFMAQGYVRRFYLFYDESKGMFALLNIIHGTADLHRLSRDELIIALHGWLKPVRRIDLSAFDFNDYGVYHADEERFENLINGNIALIHGNTFITDFVFNSQPWHSGWAINNLIPLRYNGKAGVLNENGDNVLPFMFEEIVLIDENLAFARIDGRFGILSIN